MPGHSSLYQLAGSKQASREIDMRPISPPKKLALSLRGRAFFSWLPHHFPFYNSNFSTLFTPQTQHMSAYLSFSPHSYSFMITNHSLPRTVLAMQSSQDSRPFHFFGNVWFEEPRNFLDQDEYGSLQRYMPLIQALDREWQQRTSCLTFHVGQ